MTRRLGSRLEVASTSERHRQDFMGLLDGPLSDQAAAIDDLVLSMKKPKKKKTLGAKMVR